MAYPVSFRCVFKGDAYLETWKQDVEDVLQTIKSIARVLPRIHEEAVVRSNRNAAVLHPCVARGNSITPLVQPETRSERTGQEKALPT